MTHGTCPRNLRYHIWNETNLNLPGTHRVWRSSPSLCRWSNGGTCRFKYFSTTGLLNRLLPTVPSEVASRQWRGKLAPDVRVGVKMERIVNSNYHRNVEHDVPKLPKLHHLVSLTRLEMVYNNSNVTRIHRKTLGLLQKQGSLTWAHLLQAIALNVAKTNVR